MQPVFAHETRHPKVGQNKPLGGVRFIVRVGPRNGCRHGVDARFQRRDNAADRKARCHIAIEGVLNIAFTNPHRFGDVAIKRLLLPIGEGPPEIPVLQNPLQVPVTDFAKGQFDLVKVHGFNRQTGIWTFGQHIGASRKAQRWRPVTDIERDRRVFRESFATLCGQSCPKCQLIAFAVFDAGNT